MKNYIARTFFLTFIVVVVLLSLYFLPSVSVGGHPLRKVDLLADIRQSEEGEADADTAAWPVVSPPPKPLFVDTCKPGMTCIKDYSDSTARGMKPFYEALEKVKELNRPVRIAVFGDSFIEADIFTADLREMLQTKYGGCGVGFVSVTSATNGFRPTVRHSFGGWSSHAVTDTVYFNRTRQGINSHYFIARQGAYVELAGQTKYASRLDTCEVASFYFVSPRELTVTSLINKEERETYRIEGGSGLNAITIDGRIGQIRWMVEKADSAVFYGVAMDSRRGIAVDNFSLRGSSGLSLRGIPEKALSQFNERRPYDLIILQYGLNVATERGRDYSNYQKGLLSVVEHLKKSFPQAGFLLLSIGDRDYRSESGEMRTMPGVKNLVRYQEAIAAEAHIAFWNMFEAMGGEGSMVKLVHAKPAMANYDYTHINFRGGKYLAGLLYETLMYGKEQYERRKKYEAE